jgi:hypothetical protein
VTIGYYIPGFVLTSLSFSSGAEDEVIFVLDVKKRGNMNIRVVQFYQEYLAKSE